MVDSYLRELEQKVQQCTTASAGKVAIETRHFFSGAAAYADGRIFISLTPVGLALKLSEGDRVALAALGAEPLRYLPKAPIKKEYLVLPAAIADDGAELAGSIEKNLGYVLTLPKPRPKSGGR